MSDVFNFFVGYSYVFNIVVKEDFGLFFDLNVYVDLSMVVGVFVNQFCLVFQIQKFYEKDVCGGICYIEIFKSYFGVIFFDVCFQCFEYFGGNWIFININQVIQQFEIFVSGIFQGNFVVYFMMVDFYGDFIKSFVEYGYIIGFVVVCYDYIYQQGFVCMWS